MRAARISNEIDLCPRFQLGMNEMVARWGQAMDRPGAAMLLARRALARVRAKPRRRALNGGWLRIRPLGTGRLAAPVIWTLRGGSSGWRRGLNLDLDEPAHRTGDCQLCNSQKVCNGSKAPDRATAFGRTLLLLVLIRDSSGRQGLTPPP